VLLVCLSILLTASGQGSCRAQGTHLLGLGSAWPGHGPNCMARNLRMGIDACSSRIQGGEFPLTTAVAAAHRSCQSELKLRTPPTKTPGRIQLQGFTGPAAQPLVCQLILSKCLVLKASSTTVKTVIETLHWRLLWPSVWQLVVIFQKHILI
jgi:hypothetical protein